MSQNTVTPNNASQEPAEIFISYSREDQHFVEQLVKHLKIYELSGQVKVWYDAKLTPGEKWEQELYDRFCNAAMILLLVSPDFFSSEYCIKRELPAALKRHEENGVPVVPVIVRSVGWRNTPVGELMALPSNCTPIDMWENQDHGFESVASSLMKKLKKISPSKKLNVDSIWPDTAETPAKEISPVETDSPSTSSSAENFHQSVRTAALQISVCFLRPERRQMLQSLRKWCRDSKEPLFAEQRIMVTEGRNLAASVKELTENPEGTILLLDGFEPDSAQLEEVAGIAQRRWPFNVIINAPEWQQFAVEEANASILRPRHVITSDTTLLPTLRKSLLRVRTRQFAEPRVLDTEAELSEFFELRYRVWSELKYLSEEKICPELPWELDFTDRTSLPFGVFSKRDGKLLGGARLVRGLGEEDDPKLIQRITRMLANRKADKLQRNFEYPTSKAQPFDVLGELAEFQTYYRNLVRRGVSKAEVSRVVVAPEYRQLGLGEVIVDTTCSLARMRGVRVLFLACHEKHADFYRRCQFNPVGGVVGDKFLTYRVPCLAMEREL